MLMTQELVRYADISQALKDTLTHTQTLTRMHSFPLSQLKSKASERKLKYKCETHIIHTYSYENSLSLSLTHTHTHTHTPTHTHTLPHAHLPSLALTYNHAHLHHTTNITPAERGALPASSMGYPPNAKCNTHTLKISRNIYCHYKRIASIPCCSISVLHHILVSRVSNLASHMYQFPRLIRLQANKVENRIYGL